MTHEKTIMNQKNQFVKNQGNISGGRQEIVLHSKLLSTKMFVFHQDNWRANILSSRKLYHREQSKTKLAYLVRKR